MLFLKDRIFLSFPPPLQTLSLFIFHSAPKLCLYPTFWKFLSSPSSNCSFILHGFSEEASKIWKESDIYIDNVPARLANVWKRPHVLGTNFSLIGVKHFNDWGYCSVEAFFPLRYLVLVIIKDRLLDYVD